MHARLEAGGRLLMGGDAPIQNSSKPQGFCVSVMVTLRPRPSASFMTEQITFCALIALVGARACCAP
jgi:hypothetical protein